jgi:hypothetical protein
MDHCCRCLLQRLREQRHGVGAAPGQGVRRAQGRRYPGEQERDVRILAETHSPFEPGECPGQVALAESQQTDSVIGIHEAPRVSNFLSNPEPFVPKGPALGERAQLGMAPGEVGTGEHGGQDDLTKVLAALHPVESCHALPEAVDGSTIVTLGLVGLAETLVRLRLQDNLPTGCGKREGFREGLGLAQIRQDTPQVARRPERRA